MVDLSEFEEMRPGSKCSVPKVLAKLDEEQLEKALAAMENQTTSHSAIARVFSNWTDTKVSPSTIGRHRNKTCQCG